MVLGIISWTGISYSLVPNNILVCTILILAAFIVGDQNVRSGVSFGLLAIAVMWVIGLPSFGLFQTNIFPAAQWPTLVLHLFCGISAIGLTEMLVIQIKELSDNNLAAVTMTEKQQEVFANPVRELASKDKSKRY
jgi:hypothetical protein